MNCGLIQTFARIKLWLRVRKDLTKVPECCNITCSTEFLTSEKKQQTSCQRWHGSQRNETAERKVQVERAKNQVAITLEEIKSGKYYLADDVKITKREGFSPNGWPRGKAPKSTVDVTHVFAGAGVLDLLDDGLERGGVRFRASARQAGFYPSDTVALSADYTKGSKLVVADLSPAVKASILVASLPEGDDRDEVLAAVLKALE